MTPADRRSTVRDSLGVGLTVGASGVTFGAAGVQAGMSVLQVCAASLLIFTGASQFALVGVLGAGGSPLAGVASAVALGARNAFYGVRLASLLPWRGRRRAAAAQLVTDETTAMTIRAAHPGAADPLPGAAPRLAFVVTGVSLYLSWNVASFVGAVGVDAVGDPKALGIDAAVPAAFLALVVPRLSGWAERRTALAAAVLALLAVPVVPLGAAVLVAALAVLPFPGAGRRAGSTS